jgi:hypothetical protein
VAACCRYNKAMTSKCNEHSVYSLGRLPHSPARDTARRLFAMACTDKEGYALSKVNLPSPPNARAAFFYTATSLIQVWHFRYIKDGATKLNERKQRLKCLYHPRKAHSAPALVAGRQRVPGALGKFL